MNVNDKLKSLSKLRNILWNSAAPIVIRELDSSDTIVSSNPDPVRIYSIL